MALGLVTIWGSILCVIQECAQFWVTVIELSYVKLAWPQTDSVSCFQVNFTVNAEMGRTIFLCVVRTVLSICVHFMG